MDPEPFLRAQSVPLVLAALERQGLAPHRATVALRGLRVDRDMVRTAEQLCPNVRSLVIDAPRGGGELAGRLRREYGVSLLLHPTREQLEEAEALVLFDPRKDLTGGNPVLLRLYDESAPLPALSLPPVLEEKLPEGVNRGQLLAALREAGAVKRDQIAVGGA